MTPGAPPGPVNTVHGRSETAGPAIGFAAGLERPFLRLRSPLPLLRSLAGDLLAATLPSECSICRTVLTRATSVPVCDTCRQLVPQRQPLCRICGEALDMESTRFEAGFAPAEGLLCSPCRLAPSQFERATAYATYEGRVRELLHLLKYQGMSAVAPVLAPALAEAIGQLPLSTAARLLVVPVPLHSAKQRARGYNQSDLLAREALKLLRRSRSAVEFDYRPRLLVRTRSTGSQFALSARGRRRNLQGAFALADSLHTGSHVLLIDDIYTSGATARECARVLSLGGAATVWVATLARSQRPQVALWERDETHPSMDFG